MVAVVVGGLLLLRDDDEDDEDDDAGMIAGGQCRCCRCRDQGWCLSRRRRRAWPGRSVAGAAVWPGGRSAAQRRHCCRR